MECVLCSDLLLTPFDTKHMAFVWMEGHVPFRFPFTQGIKVLLEQSGVFFAADDPVDGGVVSKKSGVGNYFLW